MSNGPLTPNQMRSLGPEENIREKKFRNGDTIGDLGKAIRAITEDNHRALQDQQARPERRTLMATPAVGIKAPDKDRFVESRSTAGEIANRRSSTRNRQISAADIAAHQAGQSPSGQQAKTSSEIHDLLAQTEDPETPFNDLLPHLPDAPAGHGFESTLESSGLKRASEVIKTRHPKDSGIHEFFEGVEEDEATGAYDAGESGIFDLRSFQTEIEEPDANEESKNQIPEYTLEQLYFEPLTPETPIESVNMATGISLPNLPQKQREPLKIILAKKISKAWTAIKEFLTLKWMRRSE